MTLEIFLKPPRALAMLLVALSCAGFAAGQSTAEPAGAEDFPRAETIFPQLEEILIAALSRSPTMIQEDLNRLAASYDEAVDRSVLYPRVFGGGSFYVQQEDRRNAGKSDPGTRSYYDLSFVQPVFHWGSLRAQADVGRIKRLLAERNFTDAYQLYANRVRDLYLQLVGARVAKRNRELQLERTRQQLETVRGQVAEGRLVSGAITSTEYAIEQLELDRDRADYGLERTLRQFRDLIGDPAYALEQVPESIPPIPSVEDARVIPLRTEYVTKREFETSPGFFRAQRAIESDRLSVRIIRNETRPKFNFAVGYTQSTDDLRVDNVEQRYVLTTLYAGFRVNWNIWDSKYTTSRARALQARIRRAERNLEQFERDLIESIESAEKEVGFATRSLRIAERNYTSAESNYNTVVAFQQEGRSAEEQVSAALFAWRQAEYSICEARRAYLSTIAAFLTAVDADPLVEKLQREGRLPR